MGRHSAPPSGDRGADRRPLLLAVAGAVVLLVVAVVVLAMTLGDGDGTTTADPEASADSASALATPTEDPLSPSGTTGDATPGTSPSTSASPTPSPSSTPPPATSSAPPAARPPTLQLRWLGTSYVRVRSGGRTLFEDILGKGATRSFDQRTVSVLIGNAAQVRSIVNGKARPRGGSGQIESFTARR